MDRLPDTPRFCQGGIWGFSKFFSCEIGLVGVFYQQGEEFYNMIQLVLLVIFFLVVLFFIEKLLVKYKKFSTVTRWLLFLPVSIIRAFSCVAIMSLLFKGIFEINDTIMTCISGSMSPIIVLLTINKTIPAKNRIIINTLGALWIAGAIMVLQNKIWNGEKKQST
jgi:cytochrome c biogenesis factor